MPCCANYQVDCAEGISDGLPLSVPPILTARPMSEGACLENVSATEQGADAGLNAALAAAQTAGGLSGVD